MSEPGYLRAGQMCRHIGISRSHWHRVVKPALVAAGVETLPVGRGALAWSVPQTKDVLRDMFEPHTDTVNNPRGTIPPRA